MHTFNLGIGSFFAVTHIDKIERGLRLCKSKSEVFHFRILDSPFALHHAGQPVNICDSLCHDLDIVAKVFAALSDSRAKSISSLLAALNALVDPLFLELRGESVSCMGTRQGETGVDKKGETGRTRRPSPSIKTMTYGLRFYHGVKSVYDYQVVF
jgi:hypothetical protein